MYLVTYIRIEHINQRSVYGYATVKNVEDWVLSKNSSGMMHFILNVLDVSDNFTEKVLAIDELKRENAKKKSTITQ